MYALGFIRLVCLIPVLFLFLLWAFFVTCGLIDLIDYLGS